MASPKFHSAFLVTSCADLSQLATWFDQALDAKTTDEIFGAH